MWLQPKANARFLIFPSNTLAYIAMGLPIDPELYGNTRLFYDMWFIETQVGRNHWIAIAVLMRKKIFLVLDSLRKSQCLGDEILVRIKVTIFITNVDLCLLRSFQDQVPPKQCTSFL